MFENKVRALLAEGQAAWGAGLPDRSEFIAKPTVDTENRPCGATGIPWIPVLYRMNSKPAGEPVMPCAGSL